MAKSLRSKTKRTFRNKKREDGIYAATEAARLHRLNAKLVAVASEDQDGDAPAEDVDNKEGDALGWCWLATFGLLDPDEVTPESMGGFTSGELEQADLQKWGGLKREDNDAPMNTTDMAIDSEPIKRISTHGSRGSRREEWRMSKGMDPKPKRNAMNRQGGLAGRRKAGRSKRRR